MFAFYKAKEKSKCEGHGKNDCSVMTKGRLSFMGTEKHRVICYKCFKLFMKPWNRSDDFEYEY